MPQRREILERGFQKFLEQISCSSYLGSSYNGYYSGLQNHGWGFDSLRVCFNHIVERDFWYVAIPIFQAKSTRRCEKTTDHNIGVKPLSVDGSNPSGPNRRKRD